MDLISRQAAIDALKAMAVPLYKDPACEDIWERDRTLDSAIDAIRGLPPAQPEIIRCTECKHYREYDSEYVENAVVVQCMADRYPISETIPDGWFCAGAERKEDG